MARAARAAKAACFMTATCRRSWLTSREGLAPHPQWTLPDPALEMLHLAPPVISTSPDPMIDTSAVSVAWAATLPEPAIDTSAVRLTSPLALTPPDPAIDNLTLPPVMDGRRRSPDPATSPSKSPATLSTLIPPDPAMAAA